MHGNICDFHVLFSTVVIQHAIRCAIVCLRCVNKTTMTLYLISGDPYNLFCHRNTDMTIT